MSDRVHVYSADFFKDLASEHAEEKLRKKGNLSQSGTGTADSLHARLNLKSAQKLTSNIQPHSGRDRLQRFWDEVARDNEALQKKQNYEKTLKKERKEAKFRAMLEKMEEEKSLIDSVNNYLALKEASDERRKQQLYDKWSQSVFDPIQAQVREVLKGTDISNVEERKAAMFEEYLQICRRKRGGVFRDIVIESDYDPFQSKKHTIKYNVKQINRNDPLKRETNKLAKEQAMTKALDPDMHIINPKSRKMVNLKLWDKLESTPYLRYEGENKKKPDANRKTNIVVDHYNVDVGQDIVRQQYFARGRKIFPRSGFSNVHERQKRGNRARAMTPQKVKVMQKTGASGVANSFKPGKKTLKRPSSGGLHNAARAQIAMATS